MSVIRGLYIAGGVQMGLSAVAVFVTTDPAWRFIAVVFAGLGALAIGMAFFVSQIGDPVEKEIDRWERNWNDEWRPRCPIHGKQLCAVRTRHCPAVRERRENAT